MPGEGQFECEACLAKVDELFNGYCKICDGYEFCECCENLFDPSEMMGQNCRICAEWLAAGGTGRWPSPEPKINN